MPKAVIKAIIVDDEKRGRETLQNLVAKYTSNVEIIDMAESAKDGIDLINKIKPDLVFLDIEMPHGSGFDLLESFKGDINFEVIFTTAFDQYAIQAIKFAALDYLLKPIDIEELQEAIKRVEQQMGAAGSSKNFEVFLENLKGITKKIALPTGNGISFIETSDIIRCEASGNYTCFYLKSKEKILVSKTLKEFEDILGEQDFYRVHNSHLVNLIHVVKYVKLGGDMVVMDDGSQIEISRRKKDGFLNRLS